MSKAASENTFEKAVEENTGQWSQCKIGQTCSKLINHVQIISKVSKRELFCLKWLRKRRTLTDYGSAPTLRINAQQVVVVTCINIRELTDSAVSIGH